MDRGANGGIIGNDARPFRKYQKRVDVTGIAQHQLVGLCICDAAALSISNRGPVIIILQQYAYSGKGRTIHSSGQLEKHGNKVDDRSIRIGGRQSIVTNDGYILPLDIINGLPYLPMSRDFTDKEWNELPHVVLTGGGEWDPRCLDNRLSQQENWKDILHDLDKGLIQTPFDEHGNYLHREHPKAKITIPDDDEEISIATPSSHVATAMIRLSQPWDLTTVRYYSKMTTVSSRNLENLARLTFGNVSRWRLTSIADTYTPMR